MEKRGTGLSGCVEVSVDGEYMPILEMASDGTLTYLTDNEQRLLIAQSVINYGCQLMSKA